MVKKPTSGGQYIPQLPDEGSESELDQYRTLAQEMIVLINVCGRRSCDLVSCDFLLFSGGTVNQWKSKIPNQQDG